MNNTKIVNIDNKQIQVINNNPDFKNKETYDKTKKYIEKQLFNIFTKY